MSTQDLTNEIDKNKLKEAQAIKEFTFCKIHKAIRRNLKDNHTEVHDLEKLRDELNDVLLELMEIHQTLVLNFDEKVGISLIDYYKEEFFKISKNVERHWRPLSTSSIISEGHRSIVN